MISNLQATREKMNIPTYIHTLTTKVGLIRCRVCRLVHDARPIGGIRVH